VADIKAATTVGTKERHIFGEDVMLYVLNTVIYLREFSPPEIPDMPTILANGQLPEQGQDHTYCHLIRSIL